MRMRVPRQASTKWWILLAAVLATVLTWWQAQQEGERAPASRGERPDAPGVAEDPGPPEGPIEFEVELVE